MSSRTETPVAQAHLSPRARWAIERAADAFDRLLGSNGYASCPEHGIDHTGKTARAIVLNCALASEADDDPFIERAIRVARAIIGHHHLKILKALLLKAP